MNAKIPMLLLMGCTASGKSKLAFDIAQKLSGEIISVDSMKVYRQMDIGTAKPSLANRQAVKHHLIDVVDACEPYGIGPFMAAADSAIKSCNALQRPIIAAGGTGMYLRGLLEGLFESPPASQSLRDNYQTIFDASGSAPLHTTLAEVDPAGAQRIHSNDFKRISRALEVFELTGKPIASFQTQFKSGEYKYPWTVIEIKRDKADASSRINQRVKKMIEDGLIAEVDMLIASGLSQQAAQAVGYAEIIKYRNNEYTLDEAIERIKINSRRLAKHQRTWFRSFNGVLQYNVAPDDTVADVSERIMTDLNNKGII